MAGDVGVVDWDAWVVTGDNSIGEKASGDMPNGEFAETVNGAAFKLPNGFGD